MTIGDKVRRTGGRMRDGQLGTLVAHESGVGVQLDRGTGLGAETIILPYSEHEWTVIEREPIAMMMLARISYDADRALRVARGDYGAKEWIALQEQVRVAWAQGGPPRAETERRALYEAIKEALG